MTASLRTKNDWRAFVEKSPPILPGSFDEIWNNTIYHVQLLQENAIVQDGDTLLDFGCGNGRLAMLMCALPIDYTGIDIHAPCIDFCHEAFSPWKRGSFQHLNVRHRVYNPTGDIPEDSLILPFADASFDSVIAASVFTHLEQTTVAEQCLKEISRVLKPGGRFFCSWFCSPPNNLTADPYRTVFLKADIRRMLTPFLWLGDGGGDTDAMHDQWAIFLKKPSEGIRV